MNNELKINMHRKHKINDDFFEKIDTEEKAYTFGFLCADGCNYKSKYCSFIKFVNLRTEKDILEKINTAISSNYIIKDTI